MDKPTPLQSFCRSITGPYALFTTPMMESPEAEKEFDDLADRVRRRFYLSVQDAKDALHEAIVWNQEGFSVENSIERQGADDVS